MNPGMIKTIGMAATIIGAGAQLVGGWVDDKKMEQKVEETVDRRLAEKNEKSES